MKMKTWFSTWIIAAMFLATGLLSACAGNGPSGSFSAEGGEAAVSQDGVAQPEAKDPGVSEEIQPSGPTGGVAFNLSFEDPVIPDSLKRTAARSAADVASGGSSAFDGQAFLDELKWMADVINLNYALTGTPFGGQLRIDLVNGLGLMSVEFAPGEYQLFGATQTAGGTSTHWTNAFTRVEAGKAAEVGLALKMFDIVWVSAEVADMPGEWTRTDWRYVYNPYQVVFSLTSASGAVDSGYSDWNATVGEFGKLKFSLPIRLVRDVVQPEGGIVRTLDPTVKFSFYVRDNTGKIHGGEYGLSADEILQAIEGGEIHLAPPVGGTVIIRISTDAPLDPPPWSGGKG